MTAPDAPVVETRAGRVRGFWRGSCATFLGIPYAEAPVGDLRFAAPVPKRPWDGEVEAVSHGPTPQRAGLGETLIPEPSVPGESTLNLNVFTPSPGPSALPVLVYIHGGGYVSGSPASPWYDGSGFARAGVVTVVISYRLGFEGFGDIPDAASNRGVRDWLCALEWVQENIAAFGGDPAQVTIAGQSAGGGAVLTLLGMPSAQHLFRGAFALSGTAVTITPDSARSLARGIAERAGVPLTAAGLGRLSEQELSDLQPNPMRQSPLKGMRSMLVDGLALGPVVDGDLITRPTVDSIAAGTGADKPLVLGAMDDEMSMIVDKVAGFLRRVPLSLPLRLLGLVGPRSAAYVSANASIATRDRAALIGRYFSDMMLRRDTARVADARGSGPTWVYAFSWTSPTMRWAVHCLDVPFFFDVLDADGVDRLTGPTPPRPLADAYHGAALSLVRDGKVDWAPWSPGGSAMVFDAAGALGESDDAYDGVRPLV